MDRKTFLGALLLAPFAAIGITRKIHSNYDKLSKAKEDKPSGILIPNNSFTIKGQDLHIALKKYERRSGTIVKDL